MQDFDGLGEANQLGEEPIKVADPVPGAEIERWGAQVWLGMPEVTQIATFSPWKDKKMSISLGIITNQCD